MFDYDKEGKTFLTKLESGKYGMSVFLTPQGNIGKKNNVTRQFLEITSSLMLSKLLMPRLPNNMDDNESDIQFLLKNGIDNGSIVSRYLSLQCTQNATFNKFQSLLFYHLKYRPITQQSLELMVEAFFCGYDFNKE